MSADCSIYHEDAGLAVRFGGMVNSICNGIDIPQAVDSQVFVYRNRENLPGSLARLVVVNRDGDGANYSFDPACQPKDSFVVEMYAAVTPQNLETLREYTWNNPPQLGPLLATFAVTATPTEVVVPVGDRDLFLFRIHDVPPPDSLYYFLYYFAVTSFTFE